ncbi:MAG TPA: hypothetical protein VIZ68_05895, partial [Thermoplasmata archaeon]
VDIFITGLLVFMLLLARVFPDRLTIDQEGVRTWREGVVRKSTLWSDPGAEFYIDDHTGDPGWSSRHEFEKHLLRFAPTGMAIPIPIEANQALRDAAVANGFRADGPGRAGTAGAGQTRFSRPVS